MKRLFAILLLAAALQTGLSAKVTLPSFFSDNMVLQQKQDVAVWGWTDKGRTVTIRPSWTKAKYTAAPDSGGTVVVRSPQVPEPVAVRYCFRNWCRGTLFNSYGIPALPFRSDDWPLN